MIKKFITSAIKNASESKALQQGLEKFDKFADKGLEQLDKAADYIDGTTQKQQQQQQQQQSGSIPFMITKQMKIDLMDLGYKYDEIKKMTPLDAQNLLNNKIKNKK